jgi:hypothetical protein
MSGPRPGHVRPNQIPQRLSPGPDISGPQAEFQRGGPDMFGFLAPQRLFLVVQDKPDRPVSETGLSGFRGFKHPGQKLPLHYFSHFSLTHTRTTMRATPRPPLVIPWFLHRILEFLGEINSPWTGVSIPQTDFFLISRYFHLILDLFAPRMDLEFIWCIVFIHVIDQYLYVSLAKLIGFVT